MKKGKYFLTFLPNGNNLFNDLIMIDIKNLITWNILTNFFRIISFDLEFIFMGLAKYIANFMVLILIDSYFIGLIYFFIK